MLLYSIYAVFRFALFGYRCYREDQESHFGHLTFDIFEFFMGKM